MKHEGYFEGVIDLREQFILDLPVGYPLFFRNSLSVALDWPYSGIKIGNEGNRVMIQHNKEVITIEAIDAHCEALDTLLKL